MKFKGSSNIFRQIMSEISTRHKSGSARDILMQSSESEIVNFQLTIGFWEKTIMVILNFCGTFEKDYQLCSLRPLAKYLKTVFIFVIWTITARTGPRRNFFLVNRVEHQKRTQTTAELPFGFVFGVQLGLRQTQALINI